MSPKGIHEYELQASSSSGYYLVLGFLSKLEQQLKDAFF